MYNYNNIIYIIYNSNIYNCNMFPEGVEGAIFPHTPQLKRAPRIKQSELCIETAVEVFSKNARICYFQAS
jgi:hypothetical protein